MFSQILRSLERLGAMSTAMGLKGDMNPDVRSDMVALLGLDRTSWPTALKIQVLLDLAPDMIIADMILSVGSSVNAICALVVFHDSDN